MTRTLTKAALFGISALLVSACGPGYLTPDQVRAHLTLPSGNVESTTMVRAADDFFLAQRASDTEDQALFFLDDGANTAFAAGALGGGMESAVSSNATPGDVLCAAGFVAQIARFQQCDNNQDCEVELNLDSCVLRAAGDDSASGRIKFKFKNEIRAESQRATLSLEFQSLTFGHASGAQAFFNGAVFVEFTDIGPAHSEVILSADVDFQLRGPNFGLFNEDLVEKVRVTVALRFTASATDDLANGTLEIIAFVDENDGERTESVVLTFSANSRRIDANTELAGATLLVRGTNGAFECTWGGATQTVDGQVASYESDGSCTDLLSGETFDWSDRHDVNS